MDWKRWRRGAQKCWTVVGVYGGQGLCWWLAGMHHRNSMVFVLQLLICTGARVVQSPSLYIYIYTCLYYYCYLNSARFYMI